MKKYESPFGECYYVDEVKEKLKGLVEDIVWLLKYAHRVSKGQVVHTDLAALDTIRQNLKEIKEIINDD